MRQQGMHSSILGGGCDDRACGDYCAGVNNGSIAAESMVVDARRRRQQRWWRLISRQQKAATEMSRDGPVVLTVRWFWYCSDSKAVAVDFVAVDANVGGYSRSRGGGGGESGRVLVKAAAAEQAVLDQWLCLFGIGSSGAGSGG